MARAQCNNCPDTCDDSPFESVFVNYLVRGGTKVQWELRPTFAAPGPYQVQLQVGGVNSADGDWADVGEPLVNTYVAFDTEQRIFTKTRWLYYRLRLRDDDGVIHTSTPITVESTLPHRDLLAAKNILRQERLRLRLMAGQWGYLLKKRVTGRYCTKCVDPQTREPRDASCPACFGTGYQCGYYYPIDCVWAELSPAGASTKVTQGRGLVTDVVSVARMLNTFALSTEDVWVSKATDQRYYVGDVKNIAEIRGVPIVANVELKLAPVSDPIYNVQIPAQLEALLEL